MLRRFTLTFFSLGLTVTAVHAADPVHSWSSGFGDTAQDFGEEVTFDSSGNVVVIGTFNGTIDFGGGTLTSNGGTEVFVAKFDPAGTHLWSQSYGNSANQNGASVATDSSNAIFVTGPFEGTIDFGGGPLIANGDDDIFLAKLDSTGAHVWSNSFGDSDFAESKSLAVGPFGEVVMTGRYGGTIDFGSGPHTSAGDTDAFLVRFSGLNGTSQFSRSFGSTGTELGEGVAIDGGGNIFVVGSFEGAVNFGGSTFGSLGSRDIFLAKYSLLGSHTWSQRLGGVGLESGNDVAVNSLGAPVITGFFAATVDFGGGTRTAGGSGDLFVAQYDDTGAYEWDITGGDTNFQSGWSVAIDSIDNVLLTGEFFGTMDLGGGPLVSAGLDEVFFARITSSGAHDWSMSYGDSDWQFGASVATFGEEFAATGYNQATVNFGGSDLVSAGGRDVFVVKFDRPPPDAPSIDSLVDVGNDQGRNLRMTIARSGLDEMGSSAPILRYEIYRRIDPLPGGRGLTDWDFVNSVPAHGDSVYNVVVPTLADSTAATGVHYSVFFVRAGTADPFTFFDSVPDSAYSIDNLFPAPPTSLALVATNLSWDDASEGDFAFYRVYGSVSAELDETASLLGTPTASAFDVQASPFAYYHVTTVDFSGNEGDEASTSNAVDVPVGFANDELHLVTRPNPMLRETSVFARLTRSGSVRLSIVNSAGRVVRSLFDAQRLAGDLEVSWDGRDANGRRVAAGVYFTRLEVSGKIVTKKLTLLR